MSLHLAGMIGLQTIMGVYLHRHGNQVYYCHLYNHNAIIKHISTRRGRYESEKVKAYNL